LYLHEHQVDIQNIHVPKTIDNDLPLPEGQPTFGYQSAKEEGSGSLRRFMKMRAPAATGSLYPPWDAKPVTWLSVSEGLPSANDHYS